MDEYSGNIWYLSDLADEMDTAAEMASRLGWVGTGSAMTKAADSLRWQIKWNRGRPDQRAGAKAKP